MSPQGSSLVATNLLGVVEHPVMGDTPYRVDVDGRPYLPVGDGGVVLGVHLGDGVSAHEGDHVAAGATLVHPDPAARAALTAYSCIGNRVRVRDGAAAGAEGAVLGKRGEAGRVVVGLPDEALARLRPGDGVLVTARGQGAVLPTGTHPAVTVLNLDVSLLEVLGVTCSSTEVSVDVRAVVPSRVVGNGVGRPAPMWDVDLALPPGDEALAVMRLGDLVAVEDLDVRTTVGYRRGWVTVGVVVHGDSPQPGHGPGLTPVLTGPAEVLRPQVRAAATHGGLGAALAAVGGRGRKEGIG